MENLKWRARAKVFAYVDMLLLGLNEMEVFILLLASTAVTTRDPDLIDAVVNSTGASRNQISTVFHTVAWILWILTAYLALVATVQTWANIKLLNSIDIELQPIDAMQRARTSKKALLACLSFSLLECSVASWLGFITLVYRVGFLVVLMNLHEELKCTITSSLGSGERFKNGGTYPSSSNDPKQLHKSC